MYDDLEYLLKRLKRKVIYVPNGGNAGDSFIAHSTYQLLNRLGVSYEIGNSSEIYPDEIIVCGGGGALVPLYDHLTGFLDRNKKICREFILLPHTIRAYGDVLSEFGQNCFIFCRERPSYEYVKHWAPNANTFLSHDLAFQCDFEETRRQVRRERLVNFRSFRRNMQIVRDIHKELCESGPARKGSKVLNAFRTDDERSDVDIIAENVDVSKVFTWKDMTPRPVLLTTYKMMRLLSEFSAVRTNRLHVGIMTAMLGLNVEFYNNSYGKNYDVFTHSMRGRFTNIKWCDSIESAEKPKEKTFSKVF